MQGEHNRPFFTVHTPSYKRVSYLERVWEALCNQTYKDFEWIVADDGSDDGTLELLKKLKKQSSFPVTIIAASQRVGKTVLDNHAVKLAKGYMFIYQDSDDALKPDALELIYNEWNTIPEIERDSYCGVTAFCEENGRVISSQLPLPAPFDTTWVDLKYKYNVTGDMYYFCRTDILRSCLLPEVDFYMAESAYRIPIGTAYKARVIDKVVAIKEYNSPNCISFSGKMKYCLGYLYAMAICWNVLSEKRPEFSVRPLKELITYFRYAVHGDVGISKACAMLKRNPSILASMLVLPISMTLALKDKLQGKVCKTHLEFNDSVKSSKISYI
ncbi:MAG: glycosyltransferase family 2 protein [Nitrospirae bacterium]|nr:MAG: glycosyltransferase family 2 protein [Nitrospirota bacterium]